MVPRLAERSQFAISLRYEGGERNALQQPKHENRRCGPYFPAALNDPDVVLASAVLSARLIKLPFVSKAAV